MAEIRCPQCKAVNKGTAQFCAECGTPLLGGLEKRAEVQLPAVTKPVVETRPVEARILQNRYRIEESLGRGGFGSVYRAWDSNLERFCAIKENLITSPDAQRQFMREATTLSNLSHPNLPRVIDHFIIPGQGQYLVMDYVAGEDLEATLGRRELVTLDEASDWVLQVTDALIYLHRQKPPIFHRDIKPANIRLTPDGRAMLVDFGLVKVDEPNQKTTMGARAITPGYAPPEQYGRGSTDARSDLYALGATFYALLTGHEPLESVSRLTGKNLPPACDVNPNVPQPVSNVIEQVMSLEPSARFSSAIEFRDALHDALSMPRMGPTTPRISQPPAQPPATVAVSGPLQPAGAETKVVSQPLETVAISQPLGPAVPAPVQAGANPPEKAAPSVKPKAKKGKLWIALAAALLVILAIAGYGIASLGGAETEALGPVERTLTAHAKINSQIQATLTSKAGGEPTAPPEAQPAAATDAPAPLVVAISPTTEASSQPPTETVAADTPTGEPVPTAAGATEQARMDFLNQMQEKAALVYGPKSGRLLHKVESGEIQMVSSSVTARNFIAEVTFASPFSPSKGEWDFGMLLRYNDSFMQYRLIFLSDQSWGVVSYAGNPNGKVLVEGTAEGLKVEAGEQNKIRVYVLDDRGWIYLNDEFLAEFDASQHYTGGVAIGINFFEGLGITGKLTEYKDFTVWKLPINP